jgi:hypothetical protein
LPYKDQEKQEAYDKAYLESHRDIAAARSRKYYQDNKEKHTKNSIKRQREWTVWARENNPKLLMLRRTQNSARTRKIECTISVDDFNLPKYCPLLGIKLVLNIGRPKGNSPSMDRIDNDKGYIPGNVCVISKEANRMKSNLTKESLEKLLDYISNSDKYRKILGS